MQHPIITWINAIEAETETAHIHLTFGEMLDAGRVVHVTQDLMAESCLQLLTALFEEFELTGRERVEVVAVGTHEMREYGTRDDSVLALQTANKLVDVALWVEAQTVHTGIKFDVHRPASNALLSGSLDKGIHQAEGVNLWLQVVVEHGLEGRHLWVHNHDILRNTATAQRNSLVGHGHGQIIYTMVLQRLGNLHGSSTIGVGFDHADQFGFRFEEGAVVVEIADDGIEIDLKNGFMDFLLQLFGNMVEAEGTRSLDENEFVTKGMEDFTAQELVGRSKERRLADSERRLVGHQARPNADELVYAALLAQVIDLGIELSVSHAALVDVAEYQGAFGSRTTGHEVEGNVQRVDVAVIGIVDEQATALTLLHLQAHGNRFQTGHAL